MFEINNNTHQLWQWSNDQRLIVKNEYCGEVHFCNIDSASPIVRHVYDEDDCRFVDVPDELLTVSKTIKAYAYNFGGEFLGEQVFIVYPRPMPENYNATEADARGSALFSCRPETEGHIVIGEDRAVSVPEALRCIAVEHDHNIETVTFDCPRYWDGHDFSEMHVYINYRCANGKLGQYPCKTVTIDEADETIIHFDWTISRNLSCSKGVVSFLVCVKKTLDDGSVENHWSSRINQEMEVLEGLECPAEEIADYPDVIEQILLRLDDVEKNGGGSGGGIANETDPTVPDWAKQPKKPTYTAEEVGAATKEQFNQLSGQLSEAIAEQGKTIPKVFDWANAELPFTESEISDTVTGAGFVVNPTNYADGKTYFRYHAGATSFKWTNPNPQKGSLAITMRIYLQHATSGRTKIVTEYSDGTNNSLIDIMYINHGQLVTYVTDPDKTVVSIRGNYDAENWVLIDMSALSIVADYPAPTGTVKSVNGNLPDENGNVEIAIPEGGGDDTGGGNTNEWQKIDSLIFTGSTVPIESYAEGTITIDPIYGITAGTYFIRKKDYTSYMLCNFTATDTEGVFNIALHSSGTPSFTPEDYIIETIDAASGSIVIDGNFDYLKIRLSTPCAYWKGARTGITFNYANFTLGAGDKGSFGSKAIEYEAEVEKSPLEGYVYYKKTIKGDADVVATLNRFGVIKTPNIPSELRVGHYNGKISVGTKVELWGKRDENS